jgi:ATP-dependent DNA helicase RecG
LFCSQAAADRRAGPYISISITLIPGIPNSNSLCPEVTPQVTPEVTPEVRLLKAISGEMTRQNLQNALGLKDDEHFRKTFLVPALQAGLIEMTIPDKPRSSKQRYRLTEKGRDHMKRNRGERRDR